MSLFWLFGLAPLLSLLFRFGVCVFVPSEMPHFNCLPPHSAAQVPTLFSSCSCRGS